jgi:hypothetical protein
MSRFECGNRGELAGEWGGCTAEELVIGRRMTLRFSIAGSGSWNNSPKYILWLGDNYDDKCIPGMCRVRSVFVINPLQELEFLETA